MSWEKDERMADGVARKNMVAKTGTMCSHSLACRRMHKMWNIHVRVCVDVRVAVVGGWASW